MIGKRIGIEIVPSQALFSLRAAAGYLGISPNALGKLSDEGRIDCFEFHHRRTYKIEGLRELKRWLIENPQREEAEETIDPPTPAEAKGPGVYFLKSPSTGLIKIGRSRNMYARIDGLRRGGPEDLIVIAAFPVRDHRGAEETFHRMFDFLRVRGEWFRISQEQVLDAIRSWGRNE